MKKIKLFEEWNTENSLWRNTSEEFLFDLLKNGTVKSKGREFISLSGDEDSGGQDTYGDVRIEFNKDQIIDQGGIEVDYEDPRFWKKYPNISRHVTGYENSKDYYLDKGYKNAKEANADMEFTWEQNCESYSHEEEFVIPAISLEKDLILSVSSKKKLSPAVVKLLNFHHIIIK
jgi:hypothetical protein